VAIKVLPPSVASDPERLQRFTVEARAAGQLNHPNVLTVYDIGTDAGVTYLVTELLEGGTLRERMGTPLPPRKIIEIASQIALGLAAAHRRGIIHRDLKPDNVFVTRDGRVKILDFGLARVVGPAGSQTSAATTLQATTPGMILGTVGYMSPEQVRGQAADARSDLFALGVILVEMATGRRAFERDTAADTMSAILTQDPLHTSTTATVLPPSLERILRRCLEKSPDERFQSARDLAFALEAADVSTPSGSLGASVAMPSMRSASASRRLPIWIALGVVAAIAGAFVLGRTLAPSPAPAGFSLAGARLQQLTFTGDNLAQPTLSPDAGTVVYVAGDPNGNTDIYSLRVGGENPVNLTPDSPDADEQPAFSPDGRQIAFRSARGGGGIFIMGATGESVLRITSQGFHPAWSPDGRELAYTTEPIRDPLTRLSVASLHRVVVATGAVTKVYDGDGVQPAWSPNGKHLVFWGLPAGSGRRALFSVPASGGAATTLLDDTAVNWSPVWSRDGAYVYFASDRERPMNLWRLPVDQETGAARGQPERLTMATDVHYGISAEANGAFAFQSTSLRSVVERHRFDLSRLRLEPQPLVIGRVARLVANVAPSPDGTKLVMMVNDGTEDLVVSRADGSGSTRLTNDAFRDRAPHWSPTSDAIYFMSDRGGSYEIWRIQPDGGGLEPVTQKSGMPVADPLISPDGRWLATLTLGKQGIGVVLFDLQQPIAQRRPRVLRPPEFPFEGRPIGWLPDGTVAIAADGSPADAALALFSPATGAIRVVRTPGIGVARVIGIGGSLAIGANARGELAAVDLRSGLMQNGSVLPPGFATGAPTPDGRFVYTVRYESATNLWMLKLNAH
jgi:Tol biopolymer transport system component